MLVRPPARGTFEKRVKLWGVKEVKLWDMDFFGNQGENLSRSFTAVSQIIHRNSIRILQKKT